MTHIIERDAKKSLDDLVDNMADHLSNVKLYIEALEEERDEFASEIKDLEERIAELEKENDA